MYMISLQGWAKVLYVIIEPNGQPLFAESTVDQNSVPIAPFTIDQLLQNWAPTKEMRQ